MWTTKHLGVASIVPIKVHEKQFTEIWTIDITWTSTRDSLVALKQQQNIHSENDMHESQIYSMHSGDEFPVIKHKNTSCYTTSLPILTLKREREYIYIYSVFICVCVVFSCLEIFHYFSWAKISQSPLLFYQELYQLSVPNWNIIN